MLTLPLLRVFFLQSIWDSSGHCQTSGTPLSSQKLTPVCLEKGRAGPAPQSRTDGKAAAGAPAGEQLSSVTWFVRTVGQAGAGEPSRCGGCSGRRSFALFVPPVSLGAAVPAACFGVGWKQRCGRKDRRWGGGNGFGAIFCSQQNTFVDKGKEISQSQKTNW